MAFTFRDMSIGKIGVIGSGQIGPDIALYFAKVFHGHDVPVVVVDVAQEALDKGRAKLEKKIARGEKSGAFSPEMARAILDGVTFTGDYQQLRGADLVVEAASENLDLKRKIFAQLEELCGDKAVLASNSSHLEPEVIFESLQHKERSLVIHYFYPAERNPLVEIVPGKDSDPKLIHSLMVLYEQIGKVPIRVGSRYGYAIDPIFEGLFLAAALCVEEGLGSVKEVDWLGREALGLTVGSFTAMNLTGGNPLTDHGLEMEGQRLNAWFHSPKLMKDAIASGKPWETPARGEKVEVDKTRAEKIIRALRGAYFGLAGQAVDAGITTVADLEMGLEIALDMKPPFSLINKLGLAESLGLVEEYNREHPKFPVPECIKKQAASGKPFEIDYIQRHDVGEVAWLRIRRPKVLNALNQQVFGQLERQFEAIKKDGKIKAAVLSGFGIKAFVSGADINFLAGIETPEQAFDSTQQSKRAGIAMENMGKPIVCALNGYALGGGLEIAMCSSAMIVARGLKMAAGQPEVNLGIIPGAGGTQRLPRWIGVEKAAEMLRTGRPISGKQGVELGLFREEVERTALIERAIELARDLAAGSVDLKPMTREPIDTPDRLPEIDIGHLSKAIDAIVCRAIVEGCSRPLAEGLKFESEMFGECVKTRDMKIGLENFLKNGPRAKAEFVHE
ncbi:MAG TPA: 3-hydroxyacyl-CoA dehydrogenase/enoyl-CoA hydratase family protein [Myxococcota bacterium]|nr:3-hydroxyacyl-CoA dehydrogenase/enoyl-CoA hydratase family protein [Myxococcota bacterium]